jgi:hypothetical protein
MGGWVGPRASLGVLEKRKICCCFWNSNAELSSPQLGHYTDYPIPAVVSHSLSFCINFKIRTMFKKYVPTASKRCVSIINKIKVKVKVKVTRRPRVGVEV